MSLVACFLNQRLFMFQRGYVLIVIDKSTMQPAVQTGPRMYSSLHPSAAPSFELSASARKPKIILCAPSNAAVDELVRRVAAGIEVQYPSGERAMIQPKVLRLGNYKLVHASCKVHTLEYKLDREKAEPQEKIQKANTSIDKKYVSEFHSYSILFIDAGRY